MRWIGIFLLLLTPSFVTAQALPEAVKASKEMIVTANPLATAAGAQMLKAGGSAVDAMVAAQTVLGLVEPQSSGIGGGAFVLYFDAESGQTTTLDARETAPAAAAPDRFLNDDGKPLGFIPAWQSGLSVGVPGVPKALEHLHEKHGRLPWSQLFHPAIKLAEEGYELTGRTSDQVGDLLARNPSCEASERLFFRDPEAFRYFVDAESCSARPAGTPMRNPDYGQTLRLMAEQGAEAFYTGDIATDIVDAVRSDPNIPGDMATKDLAAYSVVEREPVCISYRKHNVCGMGPPSSGGLAVGQILGILEQFDLAAFEDPLAAEAIHLFSQANRLAFADRNQYVADSDFVAVPVVGMLDRDYLASRAKLIGKHDMGEAKAGDPPGVDVGEGADKRTKDSGTSHIAIVDQYGNALSMTTSVEASFGNGVMVPGRGFLLNNQLTDFSFAPTDAEGEPVANRVGTGKRPRSSMSPTLIFDPAGKLKYVTGSPGGSRIIGYTGQSIINMIDFDLNPQEAINVPHYMNRNGATTDLERPIPGITRNYPVQEIVSRLQQRKHAVEVLPQTSGLSVIRVDEEGLTGGRDLRRDGAAGGR
ncbi:gamma-glutamyltransferase [Hydrocarboniclastica marina]|uniref:Glutathione hydrolase proenzyme n=1 Tax=Hydrocarboniclastica marina TaxID=2259620 RepID=A0A4V1D8C9_9ALTE|nr:gamma-glutamyltransferase [Hydrocarboniclastica marina]QCF24750.1 gamma-glutamyltransferase [Hydrocarboniclastica marina]